MEKYTVSCRLILCCNSTSKVIPAIHSRCLGVRVAAPSYDEVCMIAIVITIKNVVSFNLTYSHNVYSHNVILFSAIQINNIL